MVHFLNSNLKVRWSFLLCLAFICLKSQSFQNLVPNGSFESFTNCPTSSGQIFYASPWTAPLCNSSDYFNACSNQMNVPQYAGVSSSYPAYLNAVEGQAYAGIALFQQSEYREYIQVNLTSTLTTNTCYYAEFYAANIQYNKYCSNNLALAFSPSQNTAQSSLSCTLINLSIGINKYGNPILKDTVKWHKISGIYNALGNESYLTIGNFLPDNQIDTLNLYPPGTTPYYSIPNSYMMIDAVSVFSINPSGVLPWAYNDTTVILGDSVYIGNTMGGNFNPQWFTIGGSYITTNAGIYVKPVATTSYVVNYTVCGTPRADTIQVTVIDDSSVTENELRKMQFKAFPNPAKDELVIEFEIDFTKPREIKMIDVLGKEVKKVFIQNKKQKINIEALSNGVYYLQLQSSNGLKITKKLVKE